MRLIDSWTEGTRIRTAWRRVEIDGAEVLQCKGPYDEDFKAPRKGRASALAARLVQLQRDGALPLGKAAREREMIEQEPNVLPMEQERRTG